MKKENELRQKEKADNLNQKEFEVKERNKTINELLNEYCKKK